MTEKTCARCKIPHPITEFYNNRRAIDGKDSYCKECRKHVRDKNIKPKNNRASLMPDDREPIKPATPISAATITYITGPLHVGTAHERRNNYDRLTEYIACKLIDQRTRCIAPALHLYESAQLHHRITARSYWASWSADMIERATQMHILAEKDWSHDPIVRDEISLARKYRCAIYLVRHDPRSGKYTAHECQDRDVA